MPRSRPAYAPEFRCQMVELVRAGRDPENLSREFEPSAQSIRNWVAEIARKVAANPRPMRSLRPSARNWPGCGGRTVSSALRGTYFQKPRPGLPARPARYRPDIPVHEREPGLLSGRRHGTRARRVEGWLLRVAGPTGLGPCRGGCGAVGADPRGARGFPRDLRRAKGSRRPPGRGPAAWPQAH